MTHSDYLKLHSWIRKNLGTATYCSNNITHKSKRYDWSNISGKYKKELSDYRPLCRSCHNKIDYTEVRRKKVMGNTYRRVAVDKFDKNKKFIETYNSILEAAIKNKVFRTSIINCCKGRIKTSGGFIWEYH